MLKLQPLFASSLYAALIALASAGSAADTVTCAAAPAIAASDAGAPAKDALAASFNFDTMKGTVDVESGKSIRHILIKAVPSAATYLLIFDGYEAGDEKPAAEKLKKGESVVARLVAYGDKNHLFFDADLHLPIPAALDGYICRE